MLTSPA